MGSTGSLEPRTIQLLNVGSVTVTLSLGLFKLAHRDRDLVFNLIDRLNAYRKGQADQ